MFALAFLLLVDAVVAISVAAGGAFSIVRDLLHPQDPVELPPHQDPATITRYNDAVLDGLRKIGDPHTRKLIERIASEDPDWPPSQSAASGTSWPSASSSEYANASSANQSGVGGEPPGNKKVHDFYTALLSSRYLVASDFRGEPWKPELDAWIAGIPTPPPGLRPRLQRAGRFFHDNLVKIMVVYGTSSLLEAFACSRGVQVLASTGYLSKDLGRRLYESFQFTLYVNEPDGFVGGHAVDAILRVRLMHGCIRWILINEAHWDVGKLGLPVNGEDLLGMQMGFSGQVIRSLPKLWTKVTIEEAEDHLFLWNVVGQMLGAPMAWRAETLGEALALINAVERRQIAPSKQGRDLAAVLVAFHRERLGRFYPMGLYFMWHLTGHYICKILQVPWSPMTTVIGSIPGKYIEAVLKHWGLKIVFGAPPPDPNRKMFDVPRSLWDLILEYANA